MLTVDSLEMRLAHLSQSSHLSAEPFAEVIYGDTRYPLWAFHWGDAALPAVIVAAGIHGDEPGGIEAALRLLEALAGSAVPLQQHRLIVLPCLNPSGLADGTRSNRIGQDINRQFHGDGTQVSAAVRRLLAPVSASALADLHTDAQAQGYYLFELRQEGVPPLAAALLKALTRSGFPLEEHPFFAGYVGERGLFAPTFKQLEDFGRTVPGQSLAEWAWSEGIPRAYSLESPNPQTFERSAAMHVTALFALFAALEAESTAAQTYPAASP